MSDAKKEKIIGIDLGTSNSAASVLVGGKPTTIPSAEGASQYGKSFPSYVAFTEDGQMLVGEPARRQAVTNPENTISAIKRSMGTDHKVTVNGKQYSPQEISAFILQKIKKDAETFLGEPIEKAVITVPAYFDDNQRTATKDAGTIAGLEVLRLINEPTAASLAYGIDRQGSDDLNILVFDKRLIASFTRFQSLCSKLPFFYLSHSIHFTYYLLLFCISLLLFSFFHPQKKEQVYSGINVAVAAPQNIRVLSSTGAVIYSGYVTTAVDIQLPTTGIYIVSGENEVQKILF